MMSTFKSVPKVLSAVLLFVTASTPRFSSASKPPVKTARDANATPSTPSLPQGVTYQPPATTVTGTGGASQNTAALGSQGTNNQAGKTAKDTGAALKAAGAAMMAACMPYPINCACCPAAAMLLAMGQQADDQGDANNNAANQHGYNAGLNQDYVSDTSAPPVAKITGLGGKQLAQEVKKYGMEYDTKSGKFTLQNGKTLSASDVGNMNAMGEAGVTPDQYRENMKRAKELAAEAERKNKLAGFTNAAGSGGSGASALRGPASEEQAAEVAQPNRPKTDISGLTRNLNGDLIGVAADDIFAMMKRRYQQKEKTEQFLPPDSAPEAF